MATKNVELNGYKFVIEDGKLKPSKENLKEIPNITTTTKEVAMKMYTVGKSADRTL